MEFLTDPVVWWIDPFISNPFMRNALYASLLVVLTTSRGRHLGGATGHELPRRRPGPRSAARHRHRVHRRMNTTIGAFIAAAVMVIGINLIRNHSPLPNDTAIGVLFVGFLALAVVIVSSRSGSYTGDLNRFLFGSDHGGRGRRPPPPGRRSRHLADRGLSSSTERFLVMTFDRTQARIMGLRPACPTACCCCCWQSRLWRRSKQSETCWCSPS